VTWDHGLLDNALVLGEECLDAVHSVPLADEAAVRSVWVRNMPDTRGDLAPSLVIARNPEADSKLGFLIRLPLADGPLVLKAAGTWPRTAKL
jgi:hypothetical protein